MGDWDQNVYTGAKYTVKSNRLSYNASYRFCFLFIIFCCILSLSAAISFWNTGQRMLDNDRNTEETTEFSEPSGVAGILLNPYEKTVEPHSQHIVTESSDMMDINIISMLNQTPITQNLGTPALSECDTEYAESILHETSIFNTSPSIHDISTPNISMLSNPNDANNSHIGSMRKASTELSHQNIDISNLDDAFSMENMGHFIGGPTFSNTLSNPTDIFNNDFSMENMGHAIGGPKFSKAPSVPISVFKNDFSMENMGQTVGGPIFPNISRDPTGADDTYVDQDHKGSHDISIFETTPILHNLSTPPLPLFSGSDDENEGDSKEGGSLSINDTKTLEIFPSDSSMNTPYVDIDSDDDSSSEKSDPSKLLRNIRVSNINRLIIGQLNINSIRNKFEALKNIICGNLDVLIVTESKLDESFPDGQFFIEGYSPPLRLDRNKNGGGVLIYIREDIAYRELKDHPPPNNLEGIFFELNLKRSKWLVFGGYNPSKGNIVNFVKGIGPILDRYISKYDNFLLLGDFNSEMHENAMKEFSETYNLYNLIKEPTCFKNPLNPSLIDLILTNRPRSFQNSQTVETGLSDHHKLTVTVMRAFSPKQAPVIKTYRDYKHYDENLFRSEFIEELYNVNGGNVDCRTFESICTEVLNRHAPLKEKYMRANNSPFMNIKLSKAVMNRSRLRNKFLNNPTEKNRSNYTKYRNYCTGLFKREKKSYYNNLNVKLVTDNKKFWKTVAPFFSEKHFRSNKITLIDGDEIISEDAEVAEKFNNYFANVVNNLNIKGYETDYTFQPELDDVSNIIEKFKNHPSIQKIKENVNIETKFHFENISESMMQKQLASLDKKKPTTFKNIPTRILAEHSDIISPFITNIYNNSKCKFEFPQSLKLADITPAHKRSDRTIDDNYRPVSILPSISKVFERNMYDPIYAYVDKYLSPFLFGFRKGYSTEYCLIVMLEKWKTAMDQGKLAGALLTDLSKAFDCLNHELLVAKLEAYGFDKESLRYIYSYLSDRKHRTKVNNSLSDWADITSGVPQGSILGPLLFNIYINDVFYFVEKSDLANYADDTTPHTVDTSVDALLQCLYKDTSTLIKWFTNNYLQLNPDKCKLLISNREKDISLIIDKEVIECNKSVKLLGVTIDNRLDFNEHVSKLCKKVSTKLHALARISNSMHQDKLRLLMKAFIESQFSYCPLVWMFHSRTLNNRINRLHERSLRLVYKDYTLSFDELLRKDNSVRIHHRNLQKLVTEMYKAYHDLSPLLVKAIFPLRDTPYNLRNNNPFQSANPRSVYNGTETISYRGPKTWDLVPENIKTAKSLTEFKTKIRGWVPEGCTCRLCKTFIPNLGFL